METVIDRLRLNFDRLPNPREGVRERTPDGWRSSSRPRIRPATILEVEDAERDLGFPLPPLLRDLYLQVANGGFGPSYGLMGVPPGYTDDQRQHVTQAYQTYRLPSTEDPLWEWPQGLLPIIHLGCAMYVCIPAIPVGGDPRLIWFEPNPHEDGQPWSDSFFRTTFTLQRLLDVWMDGQDWFSEFSEHAVPAFE